MSQPVERGLDTDLESAAGDNEQDLTGSQKESASFMRDNGVPVPGRVQRDRPCQDLPSKRLQRDCASKDYACSSPPKRQHTQDDPKNSDAKSARPFTTRRNAEAGETQKPKHTDMVPVTSCPKDAKRHGMDTAFTLGQGRGSDCQSVASMWPCPQRGCGGQHDLSAYLAAMEFSRVDAFPGRDEVDCLVQGLRHLEDSSLARTLADIVRQPKMLRAVLERGVQPDRLFRSHKGRTHSLLHSAVAEGRLASVRLLVEAGASVDLESKGGETPLKLACKLGCRDVARLLLAWGANLDHQLQGRSLEKRSPHCRDTPLMTACRHGNQGVVKLLLDAGCNVDLTNSHGNNALHVACDFWNLKLTRALGRHFSNVDTPNHKGETPLYTVLAKVGLPHRKQIARCIQLAHELVLAGAKVNAKTGSQDSPLKVLIEKLPYVLLESKPGSDKFFLSRIAFLLDSCAYDEESRRLLCKALKAIAAKCKSGTLPGGGSEGNWRADRVRMLTQTLETVVQEPSSLQHLCFATVRQHLRGSLKRSRSELPLPALLKKYICLSDYIDSDSSLIGPRTQTFNNQRSSTSRRTS